LVYAKTRKRKEKAHAKKTHPVRHPASLSYFKRWMIDGMLIVRKPDGQIGNAIADA
jgi:hypothetical protein